MIGARSRAEKSRRPQARTTAAAATSATASARRRDDDLAGDLEAEPLVVGHILGLAGFQIRGRVFGVDAVEARLHERLPIAFAAHRGVAADHRQVPVRLLGVLSTSSGRAVRRACGRVVSSGPNPRMNDGSIISCSRADCFHRPGGSQSAAAPIADPSVATSTPPPARWWWRVTVSKELPQVLRPGFVVGHDPDRHRVVEERAAERMRQLGDVGFVRRDAYVIVIGSQSSSVQVVWDFETDPEYQAEAGLGRRIHGRRARAARPGRRSTRTTRRTPRRMAILRPLQQQVQRPRAVGRPPAARTRRPGLRPGQARAAQRDPRPLPLGAVGVRLPGTRLRQRRDPRPVRHRRAEGALPAAAARRRDHLLLLDDRTAGRFRPGLFVTRAERDGDDWVINGEKWFSTNARHASFFIVMAVTNPDARTRDKMSLFIVPAETPGIEIIRNVGVGTRVAARHRTATSATTTSGCPPTTCSAARARRS